MNNAILNVFFSLFFSKKISLFPLPIIISTSISQPQPPPPPPLVFVIPMLSCFLQIFIKIKSQGGPPPPPRPGGNLISSLFFFFVFFSFFPPSPTTKISHFLFRTIYHIYYHVVCFFGGRKGWRKGGDIYFSHQNQRVFASSQISEPPRGGLTRKRGDGELTVLKNG